MADFEFNTASNQSIERELLIAYLNTGTSSSPTWSAVGKRVSDSSEDYDWSKDSVQDVLGSTYTTMKRPVITQSFDPLPLDAGDPVGVKLWNLAIKEQNATALASQDMLIVHKYVGSSSDTYFAERYDGCAISINSIGGEGGGTLGIGTEITYGGTRTTGTVTKNGNTVTFTADE